MLISILIEVGLDSFSCTSSDFFSAGSMQYELGSDDIFWMNLIAGAELKKHRIALRKARLDILRIGISMIRIPAWVFNVLMIMRKQVSGSVFRYLYRWISR